MDGCFDMMHYGHTNALRQVQQPASCSSSLPKQSHTQVILVIFGAQNHMIECLQARALGDQLVVGLIPDSEILRCKGPPVMPEAERRTMVDSVKWVGEVITGQAHALPHDGDHAVVCTCMAASRAAGI